MSGPFSIPFISASSLIAAYCHPLNGIAHRYFTFIENLREDSSAPVPVHRVLQSENNPLHVLTRLCFPSNLKPQAADLQDLPPAVCERDPAHHQIGSALRWIRVAARSPHEFVPHFTLDDRHSQVTIVVCAADQA